MEFELMTGIGELDKEKMTEMKTESLVVDHYTNEIIKHNLPSFLSVTDNLDEFLMYTLLSLSLANPLIFSKVLSAKRKISSSSLKFLPKYWKN